MAERPATEKLSHEAVNYGRGMPRSHCSICVHYIAPGRRRAACEMVRSPIVSNMWCEKFKRKE